MKRFLLILFFFSNVFLMADENKTALVIGNGRYSHFSRLKNPVGEARQMSRALKKLGFEVILVENGTREQIFDAVEEFEQQLNRRQGVALFHYGGHGLQVNGENYIIPVDAEIPDERRVRSRAVNVEEFLGAMESSRSTTNIIILDACRDNPLASSTRSAGRGLARMIPPGNSIIIYSAEAGQTAQDGVFTPIFISWLNKEELSLTDILMGVRRDVREKTGGQQRPGEYSMLEQRVYLTGSDEARKAGPDILIHEDQSEEESAFSENTQHDGKGTSQERVVIEAPLKGKLFMVRNGNLWSLAVLGNKTSGKQEYILPYSGQSLVLSSQETDAEALLGAGLFNNGGTWYLCGLLDKTDSGYRVRYHGYSENWDTLIKPKDYLDLNRLAQAKWGGSWYPVGLLDYRDGDYLIRYAGYGEGWDEWIPGENIRILWGKD